MKTNKQAWAERAALGLTSADVATEIQKEADEDKIAIGTHGRGRKGKTASKAKSPSKAEAVTGDGAGDKPADETASE